MKCQKCLDVSVEPTIERGNDIVQIKIGQCRMCKGWVVEKWRKMRTFMGNPEIKNPHTLMDMEELKDESDKQKRFDFIGNETVPETRSFNDSSVR